MLCSIFFRSVVIYLARHNLRILGIVGSLYRSVRSCRARRLRVIKAKKPFAAARLGQCKPDSMIYYVKNIVFPSKTYLGFGRVDVHVHKLCWHIQQQHTAREFALHGCALKGVFHCRHHGAVAHIPPVYIKILHAAAGTAAPWRCYKPVQPVLAQLIAYLQQIAAELPSKHCIHRAAQLAVAGRHILCLPFPYKLKADLGVAERQMCYDIRRKGALARILL